MSRGEQLTDATLREQFTDAARREQLAAVGLGAPIAVDPLVFNPNNATTVTVERLLLADGSSVVRKVVARDAPVTVAHWGAGTNPSHWNHWRREPDAYRSAAVRAFEPHVSSPRLLGSLRPGPAMEVLVLEDVPGRTGGELGIDDLAVAAQSLGRAQGSLDGALGAAAFPSASREWIWAYAVSRPPGPRGYRDHEAWSHEVVVDGFGENREELRLRFGELTAELPRWRRVLASCPRTFCHLDFWSANLIMRADGHGDRSAPVLLDWSFAGIGAMGEDPGNMVPDVMVDHQFTPGEYDSLDRAVTESYLRGLAEAGWPHDPRWARLAMCVAVLKFVWLPSAMVAAADHTGPTGYAGRPGLDVREVFERRAKVLMSMLERVDEARLLVDELGSDGLSSEAPGHRGVVASSAPDAPPRFR